MDQFISMEMLGTFGGMVIITTTLTQIIKRFLAADPKWIALALAALLVTVSQLLSTPLSSTSVVVALCNWLLVTSAAIGAFEGAVKPVQGMMDAGRG